jgi:NAD-dependent deacetylase
VVEGTLERVARRPRAYPLALVFDRRRDSLDAASDRAEAAPDGDVLEALAAALTHSPVGAIALTGAGISAASDVPTFRAPGGVWERFDPLKYGSIEALRRAPEDVWEMLWELDRVLEAAEPNRAHLALAELEQMGLVSEVITQNVDGLHERAGSREVIELHGSRLTLSCLRCGEREGRDEVVARSGPGGVPTCLVCGGVLRPDVVLFGEELPVRALTRARQVTMECSDLLVIGTSAEVEPAASLPRRALRRGVRVWQIDPHPHLDTPRRIALPAEAALPELVERVKRRRGGTWGWIRELFR